MLISYNARQVFQCERDDCAHFYHPKCIAQLLYPNSEDATLFEAEVAAAREKFTCPMHECIVCKDVENKNDKSMQFAVCRRCPTVYHRKCLPRFVFLDNLDAPILYSIIMLYRENRSFFPDILYLHFAVISFSNQRKVAMVLCKGRGKIFFMIKF